MVRLAFGRRQTAVGLVVLVLSSACTSTSQSPTSAAVDSLPMLVEACQAEAASDHAVLGPRNQAWRVEVKAHKERAKAICDAWLTATRESVGVLKSQCELEARGGEAIGRVTYHPDHIARMRSLCARLAETANGASTAK